MNDQLNCDLEGYDEFDRRVKAELRRWWIRQGLAHWIPRIRFGLWLCRNLRLITYCVAHQAEATRAMQQAMERR